MVCCGQVPACCVLLDGCTRGVLRGSEDSCPTSTPIRHCSQRISCIWVVEGSWRLLRVSRSTCMNAHACMTGHITIRSSACIPGYIGILHPACFQEHVYAYRDTSSGLMRRSKFIVHAKFPSAHVNMLLTDQSTVHCLACSLTMPVHRSFLDPHSCGIERSGGLELGPTRTWWQTQQVTFRTPPAETPR